MFTDLSTKKINFKYMRARLHNLKVQQPFYIAFTAYTDCKRSIIILQWKISISVYANIKPHEELKITYLYRKFKIQFRRLDLVILSVELFQLISCQTTHWTSKNLSRDDFVSLSKIKESPATRNVIVKHTCL